MDVLDAGRGFESLSVRDLLEARDLFHNHLTGKPNVVGTAIGLYLMRKIDAENAAAHGARRTAPQPEERRLDNSSIQNGSWPCVLVFVTSWLTPEHFGGHQKHRPDDAVPTRLLMPDGRVVPVCIVKVDPAELPATGPVGATSWPDTVIGGGFPLTIEAQGVERNASVGGLVTDGHLTYAITNRHVCGNPGEPVYARLRGQRVRIGRSSDKQITQLPFSEVYGEYPGHRTWLTLDVGLVELDSLADWTSQVYGLGPMGELADISERTISLRLIGAPVEAYGAASGHITGRIGALFYRYKSVGGFDWIADFLIAPDSAMGLQTQPGDSGTIWHLPGMQDAPPESPLARPRPLALEWGGQTFRTNNGMRTANFALATALSNVCKCLDVELVTEHNTGFRRYWGSEGHYTIAALACDQVRDAGLKALMTANRDSIAFDVTRASPDQIKSQLKRAQQGEFIPLADVPDIVWKQSPHAVTGGRDTTFNGQTRRWTGPEHPTHYADADQKGPDGRTLRALCLANDANVSVAFWQSFYDSVGMKEQHSRGLLPFRVWQFYDTMVAAVQAKDATRFVCAAGIMSHYVGDACQPLHGSVFSDGYPDNPLTHTVHHDDGTTSDVSVKRGAGVHSTYEEAMIDDRSADLLAGIPQALRHATQLGLITTGRDAAVAIVALMDRAAKAIDPKQLVDAYLHAGGGKSRRVRDALWDAFGAQTIQVMADGASVLAMLWDSAVKAGGGFHMTTAAIDAEDLRALYITAEFVPSLDLDHIGPVLSAGATAALSSSRHRPSPKKSPGQRQVVAGRAG